MKPGLARGLRHLMPEHDPAINNIYTGLYKEEETNSPQKLFPFDFWRYTENNPGNPLLLPTCPASIAVALPTNSNEQEG